MIRDEEGRREKKRVVKMGYAEKAEKNVLC
jgi:hypothetical protein